LWVYRVKEGPNEPLTPRYGDMTRFASLVLVVCMWSWLGAISPATAQEMSTLEYEYLLELPSWGMLEWGSATLPQGFWYPTVEFAYLYQGSYFKAGKEIDYGAGGRDSASYMLNGSLLYGVTNYLTAGVLIPVVVDQKVDSGGLYANSKKVKSGVSDVGDIQLFLKYRVIERYFWGLATQVGVTLPSGRSYDKVNTYKESGTGDGQTDLNLSVMGDILVTEEAFVTTSTRFVHQFKREYIDTAGDRVEEKLGDMLGFDVGFVRNFTDFGMGGALKYNWWAAFKRNGQVLNDASDLFSLSIRFSVGKTTPERHGKVGFSLDFPITGNNAPATYRVGINIQSIFR
jgi:hypothetical protein